ncbi:MAG: sulfurtransferase TusA family protein [Anaerolineaceae bacterium]|nr:sulfurtransferase TusA family protein [Anaerolineaceae bacterium]
MSETADKFLDLQGLLCPIPVVKLAKAAKEIEVGQTIEAVATDPGVLADIPAWCKTTGNELLNIGKGEGNTIVFLVKKMK